jgi:pimeloyl-ACP methyl ester carboxylesterase
MQQSGLEYKSSFVNYYIFGNGPEALFCFHGYGEAGTSFAFLEKNLGSAYTLYAIDFPVHGQTKWDEAYAFMADDLVAIMEMIHPSNDKKVSLLAYSMGGRAAMNLLQIIPEKINRIALIAPDGLHQNIWYWITTQTNIGNKAFAYTMNKPKWFFKAVNASGKFGLINDSIVKFVHYYLDDKEERQLLYKRWTFMRRLKPDLHPIKKICAEKNIKMNFLFGKYDRIILSKRADIFINSPTITIRVIAAGHRLLSEKYINEIAALLND